MGDLGEDLVDGDGEDAALALDDAGFEVAALAGDVVIEHAVGAAEREPDAGEVAGGEDGDAGGSDGGGEVHGAGVVADEEGGAGEDGGAFAGAEGAAEVEDGGDGSGLAPAGGGIVAGLAFFGRSAEGEGVAGVELREAGEEGAPVFRAPVLGLHFGSDAGGEDGPVAGGGEDFSGAGVLGGGEAEIPAARVVEGCGAELGEVADEACGFGLEEGFAGSGIGLLPGELGVFGVGNADEARDAAEAKEERVAFGGGDAPASTDVDEDVRAPAGELPPEAEELARAAGAVVVADVAVDEAGALEHGGGGGGFGVGGEAGEKASLGVGKGAGDEMEGGQRDDHVADGAEAVDQDTLDVLRVFGGHGQKDFRIMTIVR